MLWSEPNSWPSGAVPDSGACVTIPVDRHIALDTQTPPLSGLLILGNLTFLDGAGPVGLTSNVIEVRGGLSVGEPDAPFRGIANITLDDQASSDCGFSYRFLSLVVTGEGAHLSLHGAPLPPAWLRLASTAEAGDTQLTLDQPVAWPPGSELVVAPSDFDPHQAEVRYVAAVAGPTVTLTAPLQHTHFAGVISAGYAGALALDARAEVGLLSRTVTVRGVPRADRARYNRAEWRFNECDGQCRIGGHAIVMRGARASISWARFDRMGDEGQLGRYALHFHRLGDAGARSSVRNASITRSSNRFVSIHGTNDLRVCDTVGYDSLGHGFYLQDGSEVRNELTGNLGLLTRAVHVDRLLSAAQPIFDREPNTESDEHDANLKDEFTADLAMPSTFWVNNLDNIVEGNAAAGSEGHGFWLNGKDTWQPPPRVSLNRAHSNQKTGLFSNSRPRFWPAAVIEGWVAYKNREWGAWIRAYGAAYLKSLALADNHRGIYVASEGMLHCDDCLAAEADFWHGRSTIVIVDSLIIGESHNSGTPTTQLERAMGRTLPYADPPSLNGNVCSGRAGSVCMAADDPGWAKWDLHGVNMYDGHIAVVNTRFVNFSDATFPVARPGLRRAYAFAQVHYSSPWMLHPGLYAENCTFADAHPLWLRHGASYEDPFLPTSSESGRAQNGLVHFVLHDKTGSVGGVAGTDLVAGSPLLRHGLSPSAVSFLPRLNAYRIAPSHSERHAALAITISQLTNRTTFPLEFSLTHINATEDTRAPPVFCKLKRSYHQVRGNIAVVTGEGKLEAYELNYERSLMRQDWPDLLTLHLAFAPAGEGILLSIPLAGPLSSLTLGDGGAAPKEAASLRRGSLDDLRLSRSTGWWLDEGASRLHLALVSPAERTACNPSRWQSFMPCLNPRFGGRTILVTVAAAPAPALGAATSHVVCSLRSEAAYWQLGAIVAETIARAKLPHVRVVRVAGDPPSAEEAAQAGLAERRQRRLGGGVVGHGGASDGAGAAVGTGGMQSARRAGRRQERWPERRSRRQLAETRWSLATQLEGCVS